jgi:hypothetical protein
VVSGAWVESGLFTRVESCARVPVLLAQGGDHPVEVSNAGAGLKAPLCHARASPGGGLLLMDTLRISVTTRCPGGPGCKCREHFGLGDYLLAATGDAHGLPTLKASETAPASVLSLIDDRCDGTLTCECSCCENERAQRVNKPRKAAPQPWESKAA